MTARALAVALGVIALAGCSSATGKPVAAATRPAAEAGCPAGTGAPVWPASLPAAFPKPADATIVGTTSTGGIDIVRFTTPVPLRTDVLFLLKALPAAGFTIGRGDEELNEADVPFVRLDHHGAIRLTGQTPCQTLWLVASVAAEGPTGPLLPAHTAVHPLPFGAVPSPSVAFTYTGP